MTAISEEESGDSRRLARVEGETRGRVETVMGTKDVDILRPGKWDDEYARGRDPVCAGPRSNLKEA